MKRLLLTSNIAILAGSLAACASAPVQYYTLQSPSAVTAAVDAAPVDFRIDVLPVGLPAQLDQSFFVIRQGDSGVAVLDSARWASPYGDELRNALSAELSHQLGTMDVAGLPTPKDVDVLRIKVQVRRLDAWPGRQVRLDADWSLSFADDRDRPFLTCHGTFDAPAKGSYAELVGAERDLIRTLAIRMAADARRLAHLGGTDCSSDSAVTRGAGS